jgi:hypothetical protein
LEIEPHNADSSGLASAGASCVNEPSVADYALIQIVQI